ncbi:MAG: COG1361 S-layer family protein [Ruminiclostridium sp.]
MRNPKMKKFISLLLVCLVFVSQLLSGTTITNAADSDDIKLIAYPEDSTDSIYSGSEFYIVLIVQNLSEANLTNVNIDIDGSSSFSPLETIPTIESIAAGRQSDKKSYRFSYDGGSNKLQVIINYIKSGNECQQEASVTIAKVRPDDTTPSVPVDPNKYAPKIIIANNSALPSGQAGSQMTYTLPVKNIAKYPAKNIVISPVLDDSIPIVVESLNPSQTIDSLKSNETKEVKFNFTISASAQRKIYPLKFNIQSNNYYVNDYFNSTETGYLNVEEGNTQPKLVLKTVSTDPSPVYAGDKFKLGLTLENSGTASAEDVSVTLLGLKNDGASIIGSSNKQTQSNINGGDASTFTFDLAASKKIEIGANSLKIKLDYKDSSNSSFSEEIEFFYNVQDSSGLSNIELKNIVSPTSSLKPGENALISFDAANTGTADTQNVKVSISSDKEIIPRTQNTIIIPSLKKGETKNIEFQLFVSDDAVTKNYPIAITVEFDVDIAGTKTKQSVMQYVGFYVENKTGKSVPRLMVDKYSIEPKTLNAGQQFTLDLSILNTSRASTIRNIKVFLSSEDGTFSTVDSNSFYIDSISPKSRVAKKILFSSKPDAPAKQYMISVNYEFEDEKGTAYTSKDSVGIPLEQTQRLVIGDVSFPTEAFVGAPIPINLSFFNMGKATLYNFMVKLEGKFKVEGSSYFVGNFEPGKSDTFDSMITPEATGPITGNILFTYEDASGKTQEVKKEISLNVMEMPVQNQFPGDGEIPPAEGGKKIPIWAFITGGVVLAAIILIVILVIRKKIKARKEFMFDEEL